jgi:hypothetical protein
MRAKDEEVAEMKAQLDEVRANAVSEAALSEIRLENELQASMLLQNAGRTASPGRSNHELARRTRQVRGTPAKTPSR